jgi:hypothetical protein
MHYYRLQINWVFLKNILLSHLRLPNLEGQVPVIISPRNRVAQSYPRTLRSLFVAYYDSQGCGGVILTRLQTGSRTCFEMGSSLQHQHRPNRKHHLDWWEPNISSIEQWGSLRWDSKTWPWVLRDFGSSVIHPAPSSWYAKTKLHSMVWVRERTISTERPPLVGEVIANFCG